MRAAVFTQYGPPEVLSIKDVVKPTPKDNEILVKVHATYVGFGDLMVRNLRSYGPRKFTMPAPLWLPVRLMFGFRKPKKQILGAQLAGEVEAIGKDVTRFKVGDAVFAYVGENFGANAEYIRIAETAKVALKPSNLSFEEAATVPYGGLMALSMMRSANIRRGDKVLINGASGSIGSFAVQFAKHHGAEVTGVCGTPRVDFVKWLGADHVIDYTKQDFTTTGETYDLIFDVMRKTTFGRCKRSLKPHGRYMLVSFKTRNLLQMLWTSLRGGKKVRCVLSSETPADLVRIRELVETGEIKTLVDRSFPLEQIVEAHRYAESGQKKGPVVVTVIQPN
jgi:NADPH:quinone reductase-like Zn-dependent oxidoreductase